MLLDAACKASTSGPPGPSSAPFSPDEGAPSVVAASTPANPSAHVPPPPPSESSAPATSAPVADGIPAGSGDYSAVLAEVDQYRSGAVTFEELKKWLIQRNLPPHKLGCAYLMIPSPMPPPGIPFDPRIMPNDWEHTWGEVAMAFWLGKLTRDEYNRLHRAAHPSCPTR